MTSSSEMAVVVGVALLAALVHGLVGDPSTTPPPVEAGAVAPGEVRLEAIAADESGTVWVDARRPSEWRRERVDGALSISLLSEEPLEVQLARHGEALAAARRVVIYCDGPGCRLSHDLAERLRGEFAGLVGGEIVVLAGGAEALREAGRLGAVGE